MGAVGVVGVVGTVGVVGVAIGGGVVGGVGVGPPWQLFDILSK